MPTKKRHRYPNRLARSLLHVFLVACALGTCLAGCVSNDRWHPAPSARGSAGDSSTGVGQAGGVELAVRVGAWRAEPPNLEEAVLPIQITLENRGSHSLRVSYTEFRFRGVDLDSRPLPPRKLVGREVEVQSDPILIPQSGPGFHAAPGRMPAPPGFNPWRLPWQDDQSFYSRQYAKWTVSLPTVEMISLSLPEGVLDPGARIEGFLYFERLEGMREPRFVFNLVDARTGVTFGKIEIPFVRR